MPALDGVDTWIFDLDNTLYPASCRLFDQIDRRMTGFIADFLGLDPVAARRLQKSYFREHGTTMRGLMDNHGLDPRVFLDYVHDIDHGPVPPDPALAAALAALGGRRLIYTNGSVAHAGRVLARLGLDDAFEAVFDIVAADFRPKPEPGPFAEMVRRFDIDPATAVFVDDIRRNLEPAAALGMTTVWLRSDSEYAAVGDDGDHIHHIADDLAGWLAAVAEARRPERPGAAPRSGAD